MLTQPPIGLNPTTVIPATHSTQGPTASLVEVFSAIQGEGVNVGTRQIFIRFGGCDLRCSYCDSAHTWNPRQTCDIEVEPGQRCYETYPNPVSPTSLLDWIKRLDVPNVHDSISFTGGEPLLQADFLARFLPRLREETDLPFYLETGGHHPEALALIVDILDLIGMDIKLPSVSGEAHWQAHREFLNVAKAANTSLFCKLIISATTDVVELTQAARLVQEINPNVSLYLQPMTPLSSAQSALSPSPKQVLTWQTQMKQILSQVRVVPQTHKMIDQK